MSADSSIATVGSWEGEDVTVSQVEAALSELRRHEPRAAVRTSVLTLVAVVDDHRQADTVLETVTELGARHPSRTVVVVAGDGPGETLDAATSVHVVTRGTTSVCFEDVCLTVRGRARYHLDSIVDPFTLPDLPVVVWLPARLPSPGDPLLASADRIVVDSRAIPERDDLLGRVAVLARRLPVSDLSWVRLAPWRRLLAGLFEGGLYRPFLRSVRHVQVSGNFGPRHLLGGWLLSRLGLRREEVELAPADHVTITITGTAGGRTGRFSVARPGAQRVIESRIDIEGGPQLAQTLHMRRQWPALSLAHALTHTGNDEIYPQALAGALALRS